MSSPSSDCKTSEEAKDEHLYDNLNSPTFETVEDAGTNQPPQMSEEERQREIQEWKEELDKVEEEILTLRQVLASKVRRAGDLKRKIGITPFQEFKQDFKEGIKSIQNSDTVVKTNEKINHLQSKITESKAYQKTNEKLHDINDKITHSNAYQKTSSALHTASEKTNAVVSSVASSVSRKIGDLRNSQTFKSMEERVGGAVANVKAKVGGSKSEDSFDEALKRETEAKGATNGTQPESLPEEKIPL